MLTTQEALITTETESQKQQLQPSLIELTSLELALVGGGSVAVSFN